MNQRSLMNSKGVQLALLTALISGIAVFANSFAVKAFKDPFVFTTLKNVLVALALTGLFSAGLLRHQLKALTRRQWLQLGLIGLVGGSTPFLLFFKGISQMPTPVMAAFIHKTLFIWVALLALPLLKEKLNKIQWLALAVLLLGTYSLGSPKAWHWGTGEWLVLSATWLWAAETILAKRILRNLPVQVVAWGRMALGSVFLLAFLAVTGRISGLFELSARQWSWSLVSLVFLTGYVLTWFHALKRAPAAVVASVLVLAAPITALLTSLLVTHRISNQDMIGVSVIAIAISLLISQRPKQFNMSVNPVKTDE